MKSTIPKTHLFLPEDLHLYDLPQIFSASALWFEAGMQDQIATFDLTVRDAPPHRNFLLFGGLEEIIEGIKKWQYSKDEVNELLKNKVISKKFAGYLKKLKFSGSVFAMPEGTVFFPGEPVIRVTAPIIEANLLTMFLLNAFTGNTKILSKIIRPVIAAASKTCIGLAGLRADSFEFAMKGARAAYIAGAAGSNSVPSFAHKFNLELVQSLTNAYHAVIKSFPTEIEAMRCMSVLFNGRINLTVDTYDFYQGMKNAIVVARELKSKGMHLAGVFIDSGDLLALSSEARKMLDDAGLKDVRITVATNLDEYKIKDLMNKNIQADNFLVATEITTVSDSPKLETVYKLAELKQNGKIIYCAKFSPGKESYPASKQVFRLMDNKSKIRQDIIGLENEELGKPLLIQMIKDGKIIYNLPNLDEIKDYIKSQIDMLPKKFLDINKQHKFNVTISKNLNELFEKVKKDHCVNMAF